MDSRSRIGSSVITVGGRAESGLSTSAWTGDAAIRADVRGGVHLPGALLVTDSHLVVRR